MVNDLCENSAKNIENFKIKDVDDARNSKEKIICFSLEIRNRVNAMRTFLYENFYMNEKVVSFTDEGMKQIKAVFKYFLDNPEQIPEKEYLADDESLYIRVKDYVAGMTDPYLKSMYKKYCL